MHVAYPQRTVHDVTHHFAPPAPTLLLGSASLAPSQTVRHQQHSCLSRFTLLAQRYHNSGTNNSSDSTISGKLPKASQSLEPFVDNGNTPCSSPRNSHASPELLQMLRLPLFLFLDVQHSQSLSNALEPRLPFRTVGPINRKSSTEKPPRRRSNHQLLHHKR